MPEPNAPIGVEEARALLGPLLATPALLAVSGGPDSVAMMGLAARVAAAPPVVATVDHGLRPGSTAEAETVARWAATLGLTHRTMTWTGAKPSAGLQAAARKARYRLLRDAATELGLGCILTAHTLDDQAETVLMRVLAGSGVGGLASMRPFTDLGGAVLARPFLAIAKTRLQATCDREGWTFLRDPSNADPRFARTRLRALMPALTEEGASGPRLARLAERAGRAEAALDAATDVALRRATLLAVSGRMELCGTALAGEPEEIALRVLGRAVFAMGGIAPRLERLERLASRLRSAGRPLRATLAGILVDRRPDGRVVLTPEPARREPQP